MELQFFAMLADICRAFPAEYEADHELTCRRPQAFAVLQKLESLNSDNLDKASPRYASAPYFFSHRFEDAGRDPAKMSYGYPLVAIAHQTVNIDLRKDERRHQYNLAVFDQVQVQKDTAATGYCLQRTFEERARDLTRILQLVLEQFSDWQVAHNETTGEVLLLSPAAAVMPPTGYRLVHTVDLLLVNQDVRAQYIPNAYSDQLDGVFATIEIDFSICRETLDWQYPEPVAVVSL